MTWNYDDPHDSGYYLATVMRDGPDGLRARVSELWFNPDSIGKWWATRGYLSDESLRPIAGVVAWMAMPVPASQRTERGTSCPSCCRFNVAPNRNRLGEQRGMWCRDCGSLFGAKP